MTLFEDIWTDLLLEGKTPEEILAALKYRFKDVPENVIDELFKIDPTKKRSYVQWVLSHWKDESELITKLLNDGKLKKVFEYIKSKNDVQLQGYKSVKEMYDDLQYKLPSDVDLLQKDGNGPENDFTIMYDTPEWTVVTPNTYEASHKLGVGTKWCTAGWYYNNGKHYYDQYLQRGGKYYINFDKRESEVDKDGNERPYKRYQFHFESNQFMDIQDDSIDIEEIDIPEDVINFYGSIGYDKERFESEDTRRERYYEERINYEVYLSQNLMLAPQWNDEYDIESLESENEYQVYDTDYDTVDSIFPNLYVNKIPLFIGDVSNATIVILNKDTEDSYKYKSKLKEFNENDNSCEPVIIGSYEGGRWERYWEHTHISYYKILSENTFLVADDENDEISTFYNTIRYPSSKNSIRKAFSLGSLNDDDYEELIECVWDDGFHSLLRYNDYAGVLEYIIKNDKPIDEYFVVEEDENGDLIVKGEYGTYYVDKGNYKARNKRGFHLEEEIDDGFYIVETMDNHKNVYDTNEKRFVFDEDFEDIKTRWLNNTIVMVGKKVGSKLFGIYDYISGKKLLDKEFNNTTVCYGKFLVCRGGENDICLIDDELKVIKPISQVGAYVLFENGWVFLISLYYTTSICYNVIRFEEIEGITGNVIVVFDNGKKNITMPDGTLFLDKHCDDLYATKTSGGIIARYGNKIIHKYSSVPGCEYDYDTIDVAIRAFENKPDVVAVLRSWKEKTASAIAENFNKYMKRLDDVEF